MKTKIIYLNNENDVDYLLNLVEDNYDLEELHSTISSRTGRNRYLDVNLDELTLEEGKEIVKKWILDRKDYQVVKYYENSLHEEGFGEYDTEFDAAYDIIGYGDDEDIHNYAIYSELYFWHDLGEDMYFDEVEFTSINPIEYCRGLMHDIKENKEV